MLDKVPMLTLSNLVFQRPRLNLKPRVEIGRKSRPIFGKLNVDSSFPI